MQTDVESVKHQPLVEGTTMNPLLELRKHNQAVWLDYIRRDLIIGGGLRALVEQDGLRGVTSNPTIFEKAIDGGTDYDCGISDLLARNPSATAKGLYDALAIEDVRHAADVLRPSYEETGDRMVLSASSHPLNSLVIQRPPSKRHSGCGGLWIGRIS
jgi:hypothetical protein